MFLSFCILDDFFRFSKNLGFWVLLVHPTVVSVLLSASVERCFVSRMRDFFKFIFFVLDKSRNLSKIVSVLLSASVERFFVSRMRDFLKRKRKRKKIKYDTYVLYNLFVYNDLPLSNLDMLALFP